MAHFRCPIWKSKGLHHTASGQVRLWPSESNALILAFFVLSNWLQVRCGGLSHSFMPIMTPEYSLSQSPLLVLWHPGKVGVA